MRQKLSARTLRVEGTTFVDGTRPDALRGTVAANTRAVRPQARSGMRVRTRPADYLKR